MDTTASLIVGMISSACVGLFALIRPARRAAHWLVALIGALAWVLLDWLEYAPREWTVAGVVVFALCSPAGALLYRPVVDAWRLRRAGFIRVEPKIEAPGGTTTAMILDKTRRTLDVVGFAASKFLASHQSLERISRGGKCRFVLANPEGGVALRLAKHWKYETEDKFTAIIRENLAELKWLRERECDIDVRFAPVDVLAFRLVISDRKKAYISYYRPESRGLNLPQLLVKRRDSDTYGFADTLLDLFDALWAAGEPVDWDAVQSREPTKDKHAT